MNPIEGLSLVALRAATPPAWLAPWIRRDFTYGLVQTVVNVLDFAEPTIDDADALLSLIVGLSRADSRWYLVTARTDAAWADAEVVATSAAAGLDEVASARRGHGRIALVLTPPSGPAPRSLADALSDAELVLLVLDTWDAAVVGAPDVLSEASRIGAHVWPDTVDPPQIVGSTHTAGRARAVRGRTIATVGGTVAAVVAGLVITWNRAPAQRRADTASAAPVRSAAPGLFLPSATRFPGGRIGASASFDPLTGSVTLFGGGRLGANSSNDVFPRDTWSWDVNGWRRRDTQPTAPPPVSDAAFAYDETTGSGILFGGIGGDGSTWRWNGLAWQQLKPAHHPAANVFASAVFDPRRGAVVLATLCCQTSQAGNGATLETWEWRDDDWVPLRGRDAPVLSRTPLIAYDLANGRLLLFTQGSTPASDTTDQITTTSALWSFDDTAWHRLETRLSPPYDPIRDRFGYDPASGQVALFQGGDLPTWTWRGSSWLAVPAGGPLYSGAMTADATVGRILLFGGQVASDDLSTVWTLESNRWKNISGR